MFSKGICMPPNAGAIESTRGGGAHGHLAILLKVVKDAVVLSNGIPFITPVHHGPVPIILTKATATTQHTEILRLYAQDIADLAVYTRRISTALKKQLIIAVPNTDLQELEDTDVGYLQVSPVTILDHLMTLYGIITCPQELADKNRAKLATSLNPDASIEDLWRHVDNTRHVAIAGASPIDEDISTINSLLTMFEKSGLLSTTIEKFRLRTLNEWQMDIVFKTDVTIGNKERLRKLVTAGTACYHGTHVATTILPSSRHSPNAPAALAARTNQPPAVSVEGKMLYYCWSHGLNPHASHTSLTCTHRKEGHQETATVSKLLHGGCTAFRYLTRPRYSSAPTTN